MTLVEKIKCIDKEGCKIFDIHISRGNDSLLKDEKGNLINEVYFLYEIPFNKCYYVDQTKLESAISSFSKNKNGNCLEIYANLKD